MGFMRDDDFVYGLWRLYTLHIFHASYSGKYLLFHLAEPVLFLTTCLHDLDFTQQYSQVVLGRP